MLHCQSAGGSRFALDGSSSASESSTSSSSSLSQQAADELSDDEAALLCSMLDAPTLDKLTKHDVLLLWQAAEAEWSARVRSLRKQRDFLHLRYQHAKDVALPRTPPPPVEF